MYWGVIEPLTKCRWSNVTCIFICHRILWWKWSTILLYQSPWNRNSEWCYSETGKINKIYFVCLVMFCDDILNKGGRWWWWWNNLFYGFFSLFGLNRIEISLDRVWTRNTTDTWHYVLIACLSFFFAFLSLSFCFYYLVSNTSILSPYTDF